MRKLVGWAAFLAGSWMLVSPQALMGLNQLKWMHQYAFSGEVLGGILLLAVAYYLLDLKPLPSLHRRGKPRAADRPPPWLRRPGKSGSLEVR